LERRLTAILAADVVGYSRLMGVDEAGTLTALKSLCWDLVKPKEVQYRDVNLPVAATYTQLGRPEEAQTALRRYSDWTAFIRPTSTASWAGGGSDRKAISGDSAAD